jgi:hypothetical protein
MHEYTQKQIQDIAMIYYFMTLFGHLFDPELPKISMDELEDALELRNMPLLNTIFLNLLIGICTNTSRKPKYDILKKL